jgi:hypothetical protein
MISENHSPQTEELVSKHTEKQRRYYENNRDAWNKYQREYKRRKYNEDPEYRLRMKEYMREYYKSREC